MIQGASRSRSQCKGNIKKYFARKEIIISASSINSPRLLLLSGVGPADELKELGINTIVNLKGVGLNYKIT